MQVKKKRRRRRDLVAEGNERRLMHLNVIRRQQKISKGFQARDYKIIISAFENKLKQMKSLLLCAENEAAQLTEDDDFYFSTLTFDH